MKDRRLADALLLGPPPEWRGKEPGPRQAALIAAYRSGEYTQVYGVLHQGPVKDKCACALGVAEVVEAEQEPNKTVIWSTMATLTHRTRDYFALWNSGGYAFKPDSHQPIWAGEIIHLNDTIRLTLPQIADLLTFAPWLWFSEPR